MSYIGWDRGGDDRTGVHMDSAAVKQAIAYFLSRQGAANFDPENVALMFNEKTGEVLATALSRAQ